jgi:hypothetical protein
MSKRGRVASLLALLALLASGGTAPAAGQAAAPPPAGGTAPAPVLVPPTTSALRQLIEQPGRVVVRRRHPLPAIGLEGHARLRISAVGAFEPGYEEQRILGLRIDLDGAGLSETDRTFYLDIHEVESLLHAITLIQQVVADQQAGLTSEAAFHTIEGFGLGVVLQDGKPSYYVEGMRTAPVLVGLSAAAFTRMREEIDEARHRLFE